MKPVHKLYNTIGRVVTALGLTGVVALLVLTIFAAVDIMMIAPTIKSMIVLLVYIVMIIVILAALFLIYQTINIMITVLSKIKDN
jgi:hypothetical protein